MKGRRLGGLFSGIGGFELAWQRNGGEVAWMCEIDPAARRVLAEHFPGVPVYPDIRELDPTEIEPVDVLSGGSPCQGFSIGGAQQGMEHAESKLFADYVRVMDGLVDRGLRYSFWENVPGVLTVNSGDGERTFAHVLAAFIGAGEPVQLDRRAKWSAGLVAAERRAVAWRILDSQHFGVSQRRRRLYACAAFGDSCADRAGRVVLASGTDLRGDLGQVFPPRESAAETDGRSFGGELLAFRKSRRPQSSTDFETWVDDGLANTLNLFDASPSRTTHLVVDRSDGGMRVRRLVPTEWERLQGFPDGWTEPAVHVSSRFQALGNAVTVSIPQWLFSRVPEFSDESV